MSRKESFILYHSFYPPIKEMSLEDKGRLFEAIFSYHREGIVPELPEGVNIAFQFMKCQFERNALKYEKICQRNKENIGKRWEKNIDKTDLPNDTKNTTGISGIPNDTKNTDNDNDNDNDIKEESIKKKNPRFSPPSLSEIQNYFTQLANERGLKINTAQEAEKYESFYTSKGWYVGKNKMVDWRAAVRTWLKNVKPTNGHSFEPLTREKSLM